MLVFAIKVFISTTGYTPRLKAIEVLPSTHFMIDHDSPPNNVVTLIFIPMTNFLILEKETKSKLR